MSREAHLTSVEWLSSNHESSDIVIVDCHWDSNAYLRAHIPGAIMRPGHPYIKSEDKEGKPQKHLPNPEEFEALMNALGIHRDITVICYDEWHNHFATRLWWLLKYYGHEKSMILDGGWQAWVQKQFPVSTVTHKPQLTDQFEPLVNPGRLVELDELLENYTNPDWQVIDVRSDGEFDGTSNPGNNRSGHVPGAIHLEWNKMLVSDDTGVHYFRSNEDMERLLSDAGVSKEKKTVVHCQSGVRATFMAYCLEILNYPHVKVYDGSMGEWANLEETPLEK